MAKRYHTRFGSVGVDYEWNYWTLYIGLPAFKQFRYSDGRNRGFTRIPIRVYPYEPIEDCSTTGAIDDEFPDIVSLINEEYSDLIDGILANQLKLTTEIKSVVWSYLSYCFEIEQLRGIVAEDYDGRKPPKIHSVEDVGLLIGVPSIDLDSWQKTLFARFNFIAVWDIEHAIGLCTDGNRITGIGGSHDAFPSDDIVDAKYVRHPRITKGRTFYADDLEELWTTLKNSNLHASQICKHSGCSQRAIELGVLCPEHHFQMLTGKQPPSAITIGANPSNPTK